MIGKLDESLNFHSTALLLRAERQQLLASNIANADTPGYQARDFNFGAALAAATGGDTGSANSAGGSLARTDAKHLDVGGGSSLPGGVKVQYRAPSQAALDNNSVDVDVERAQFADNTVRYEASLRFLNQQIKNLLSAIQSS